MTDITAERWKKIKLIALDLDCTTLRSDKTISPETRLALRDILEQGIHVAVASGRSFASLPAEVLHFPGIEYAITGNGAAVYRMAERRRCHEYLLKPEAVDAILEELPGYCLMEVFIDGVPYGWKPYAEHAESFGLSERGADYVRATRKPVEDIRGFIREHREELDSLDVITRDAAEKEKIRARLVQATDAIYMTSSADQLLEISDCQAGKHAGLSWLCGRLGLTSEETMAFGDAENDRDMLICAGIGVAMGNGQESVKRAADLVTAGNDEDGVALVLRRLLKERECVG